MLELLLADVGLRRHPGILFEQHVQRAHAQARMLGETIRRDVVADIVVDVLDDARKAAGLRIGFAVDAALMKRGDQLAGQHP